MKQIKIITNYFKKKHEEEVNNFISKYSKGFEVNLTHSQLVTNNTITFVTTIEYHISPKTRKINNKQQP